MTTRNPDGQLEEQLYNDDGTLHAWAVYDASGTQQWITMGYTPDGLLASKTYPDGGALQYSYDSLGRRIEVDDLRNAQDQMGGSNRMTWSYDTFGNVAEVLHHDGRLLDYTYSADGQRTGVTVNNGTSTEYTTGFTYDMADRLSAVYDGSTQIAQYSWDANGNRSRLDYTQLGASTMYSYNAENQLTGIASTCTGATLCQFNYTVDGLGRRTQINEQLCDTTNTLRAYQTTYGYDQLSRMLTELRTRTGVGTLINDSYSFDLAGNRLTKDGQPYSYNANSDKLASDGTNAYSFDLNGDQLAKGGWQYTYDWDHQLKTAIAPDGKVIEYRYDPDGNRIRKDVTASGSTVTTQYVVDAEQPYAQVLMDLDGAGNILAQYTYGDDLLKVNRNGDYYYFYDGLGSTRVLTDSVGQVVNNYTYDAYGNQLPGECTATVANEFLFTGERVDADTGLTYLRARDYDATTGRFIQLDSHTGDAYDPQSLHRYLYCQANPVNGIDPSGHDFELVAVGMDAVDALAGSLDAVAVSDFVVWKKKWNSDNR